MIQYSHLIMYYGGLAMPLAREFIANLPQPQSYGGCCQAEISHLFQLAEKRFKQSSKRRLFCSVFPLPRTSEDCLRLHLSKSILWCWNCFLWTDTFKSTVYILTNVIWITLGSKHWRLQSVISFNGGRSDTSKVFFTVRVDSDGSKYVGLLSWSVMLC